MPHVGTRGRAVAAAGAAAIERADTAVAMPHVAHAAELLKLRDQPPLSAPPPPSQCPHMGTRGGAVKSAGAATVERAATAVACRTWARASEDAGAAGAAAVKRAASTFEMPHKGVRGGAADTLQERPPSSAPPPPSQCHTWAHAAELWKLQEWPPSSVPPPPSRCHTWVHAAGLLMQRDQPPLSAPPPLSRCHTWARAAELWKQQERPPSRARRNRHRLPHTGTRGRQSCWRCRSGRCQARRSSKCAATHGRARQS